MNDRQFPDYKWLYDASFQRVLAALSDGEERPRIVGGAVRDGLLGLTVKDIDIATPITPDIITKRLQQAEIKAIPTGIDHGTVTAVADGKSFEITSLRRDVSTDGRRATVAFSTNWQEDAARRDFTINALYVDPVSRQIFDYFGGLDDLDNRQLRFIGDAGQRIAEDHLRILRYFRFLARFGNNQADAAAIKACADAANSLMALSRERISSELMKIIATENPLHAVTLMIENGIFNPFLPELSASAIDDFSKLVTREQQFKIPPSQVARLIALLPAKAEIADKVAMRMKLSNRTRKDLAARLKNVAVSPANIHAIAYKHGNDAARDAAMLFASDNDVAPCLDMLKNWQAPAFPLKGGALIQKGLKAGPIVAMTLQAVERKWVDSGFIGGEALDTLIDQQVSEALLLSKKE